MSKGEKSMKCEKDGISDLPHEILSSLVSYCTVRDAVSASMLSRRWRHLRLHLVESLSILSAVNWVQSLSECMTAFIKVKKFEFFSYEDLNLNVPKIIDILKSCPLLEKIHLVSCKIFSKRGKRPTPQRLPPKSVHKHLKEIHIGGFTSNAGYMELALYLLEYAAALERMVIDSQCKVYVGLGKWMELCPRQTFTERDRAKIWLRLKDHSKSSVVVIC